MNSGLMTRIGVALIVVLGATAAQAGLPLPDYDNIGHVDPLAQRDEWGLVHQRPHLNDTDFAPRYQWRFCYYFKSGQELTTQPAYVGSMQVALRRLGYYCGPVDGIFSALDLIPTTRPTRTDIFGSVTVDYKLFLNIFGLIVFTGMFWLTLRRRERKLPPQPAPAGPLN